MSTQIQKSGYQSNSRLSPTALGGVLLVHAGLGAAILTMSAVQVIDVPDVVMWARNIPKDEPKLDPMPKPRAKPDRVPEANSRPTIEPTIRMPDDQLEGIRLNPDDLVGTGPGTGPTVEPVRQPDPPTPVLVQARPDPRYADIFQPPYPPAMLRMQMEGSVTVRITIAPDGRVTDVALVSAADPAFFEATRRQAIARWRFTPATRDGQPISSEKLMTVRFNLTD
ncbi:MAG: TonB family protein [Sphingobium sp.]